MPSPEGGLRIRPTFPSLRRIQQEATCEVICLRTVARYPDGLKRNRATRLAQIRPVDMGKHSYRARLKHFGIEHIREIARAVSDQFGL